MDGEGALHSVREKLRKKYIANAFVKFIQDARAPKLDVRDLYVGLAIIPRREMEDYSKSTPNPHQTKAPFRLNSKLLKDDCIPLSDIFPAGGQSDSSSPPINTVALVGPAGCGKTMAVTKKLPLQWLEGEALEETVLVFVITVRSLHERLRGVGKNCVASIRAHSFEELLTRSTRELDDNDIAKVMEFLRSNTRSERVLFIVDGKRTKTTR